MRSPSTASLAAGQQHLLQNKGVLGCLTVSGSDTPRPPRKQDTMFLVGTGATQAKNMSFHTNSLARSSVAALKFVTVIHLSAVRRLVDVIDSDDCDSTVMSMASTNTMTMANPTNSALVAIVCRLTEDLRERCYTLKLVVDNVEDKLSFLRTVCRHVSN